MSRKRKIPIQFRYYDMPLHRHAFALLGDDWKRNYGNDVNELHFHNFMEIGICRDGNGILIVGEKSLEYHGGMISILPENTLHTTISRKGNICFWEYLYIDVTGFFHEYYQNDARRAEDMIQKVNAGAEFLKIEETPKIYRLAEAVMDEERVERHSSREIVNGLLCALLLTVARENKELKKSAGESEFKLEQIQDALSYLQKNYRQGGMLVEELAGICHMSETHFRRVFVECMHMTPLEYINFVRVQKACEMILKTNYSMELIAEQTGFLSQSSFIRNFKEFLGSTPYQWKKQSQREPDMPEFKISAYNGW